MHAFILIHSRKFYIDTTDKFSMKTHSVSRRKANPHPKKKKKKRKEDRKKMQIKFNHSSRLGNEFFLNRISPFTFIILGEYCEIQKGIHNEYIAM